MDYSKNKEAEKMMGLRQESIGIPTIILNSPAEEGYSCPVCKNQIWYDKDCIDERLQWSEYNSFLWCEICNKDYPSCLCIRDNIDKATEVFLKSVNDAIGRNRGLV